MMQQPILTECSAERLPLATTRRLDAAVEQTPNLVAVFDEFDKVVYANPAFRCAYGFDNPNGLQWCDIIKNAFTRGCGPVIDADAIDDWLTRADTRRGTLPFRSFEVDFHDGRWFLITETMQPDGTMLLIGVDITTFRADSRALREERDRAVRAAWTDPLTGLANRRYCLDQLEEWRSNAREEALGSLAMIDLDHFKEINDTYGHEFGDRVLVDFGRFVLDRVRLQDLFGRIGGEEFLLFMPECPLPLAKSRLEDIMVELESHTAIPQLPTFRYTFSGGLIALTPDVAVEDGMQSADQLLYQAKLSGRTRVTAESPCRLEWRQGLRGQ